VDAENGSPLPTDVIVGSGPCTQCMHRVVDPHPLGLLHISAHIANHQAVASWTTHGAPPWFHVIQEAYLAERNAIGRKAVVHKRGARHRQRSR
jgi:hypothetical protein